MKNDMLRLSLSESRYGFSPLVNSNIDKWLSSCYQYPQEIYNEVIEKISAIKRINTENILIGNGLDDVINLFTGYMCKKNLKIVTTKHTFNTINLSTQIFGKPIIELNLDNLCINIDSIIYDLSQITDIGIVYICNPHNPTGQMLKGDLEKLLAYGQKHDIIIFVDEAYIEFVENSVEKSCEQYLEEYDNLVIGKTMSKIYGLAGLRFGYALASNSELIKEIRNCQLPYPVNKIACHCAIKSLDDQSFVKDQYCKNFFNRQYFETELKKNNIEYMPSNTNFILIKSGSNAKEISYFLEKDRDIIVKHCEVFELDEMLRVGVGLPDEVDRFMCAYLEAKNKKWGSVL